MENFFKLLLGIKHFFLCSYGNWEVLEITRDADFGVPLVYQAKVCKTCSKIKIRVAYG